MVDALGPDARAAAAVAVLVTLPGLLVVRSPWRAMPALSLAFWTLSWTWLGSAPRTRLLQATLAAFGVLGVLRILRPGPWPRLRATHAALAAATLAAVVPLASRPVAPGSGMPLVSLAAELLVWRDGWPASFEPLLPVHPFRASALATLAADVALLSGAEPHRAALAASVAGTALAMLACWSLAAWRGGQVRAALVSGGVAVILVASRRTDPGVLAAAFALESAVLWLDRRGIPSAFAAGACAASALAADAGTALCVLAATLAVVSLAGVEVVDAGRRARVALLTALVLSLPLALRGGPVGPPASAPLVAVAVVLASSGPWRAGEPAGRGRLAVSALVLAAATTWAAIVGRRTDELCPTPDDVAAMTWIRQRSRPLDLVCAPDLPAARWVPAIAGRAVTVSVAPGWPAAPGPCTVWLSLSGRDAPAPHPSAAPEFRTRTAAVWRTSQTR